MSEKQKSILNAWDRIVREDPDISTEKLFAKISEETNSSLDEITDIIIQCRCT